LVDDIEIEERTNGRRLGVDVRHKRLWYLDRHEIDGALHTPNR
jgi:hypothetical protein